MDDARLAAEICAYANERGFRAASVERWLALAVEDAAALWELVGALRLGENQARNLWEWAEEIAARDGTTMAKVLTAEAFRAALHGSGGRNDRLKAVKAHLRRRRFPTLARAEDRLAALIADLELPSGVKLSLPEFLEGDEVRVEIVAADAKSLLAAANRIAAAAATPACEEIFELLSEAPSK
jgi:hypothetical protein